MPRLNTTQAAALAAWWPLVQTAASGGYTSTDVIAAAADLARQAGGALSFAEGSAISTLYGYARRMANAAAAVQAATPETVISGEHVAVPPWARDEVAMATAPIWHVTYTFTYLDQAGNQQADFRTSVFEMTLPTTAGELAGAIAQDAQALADKYGVTLLDAQLHQILAV